MRASEITGGAWREFQQLKALAHQHGQRLGPQLHVPRAIAPLLTRRERRLRNLKSPWAWEPSGDLKQKYADWEGQGPLAEAQPHFIPGNIQPQAGGNKPSGGFWTSTAIRSSGSTYTSEWSEWVENNMPEWWASVGYIYSVRPGALVLPLNSSSDAQRIAEIMHDVGRAKNWRDNRTELGPEYDLRLAFPWDTIAQHFHGVHHTGGGSFSLGMEFTMGWDVESTVWFNTDVLQYRGEVRVDQQDGDQY